jgi:hypothetical protein
MNNRRSGPLRAGTGTPHDQLNMGRIDRKSTLQSLLDRALFSPLSAPRYGRLGPALGTGQAP